MAEPPDQNRGAYQQLELEIDCREGMRLEIGLQRGAGCIRVVIDGAGEDGKDLVLSRRVGLRESYDKCAAVMLASLRKEQVL